MTKQRVRAEQLIAEVIREGREDCLRMTAADESVLSQQDLNTSGLWNCRTQNQSLFSEAFGDAL